MGRARAYRRESITPAAFDGHSHDRRLVDPVIADRFWTGVSADRTADEVKAAGTGAAACGDGDYLLA